MLLEDVLTDIIMLQEKNLRSERPTVKRDLLDKIDVRLPHAVIISGIRRCGKSTLLKQLMQKEGLCNYFNFDDHRAAGFELSDFNRLDHAFEGVHTGIE
jgi:predicted AAA+ superfamily ATPase